MVITKLDAARIQLDAAIEHFFQGNHICAVTLAGAAEDIFSGLLKSNGKQSAFEFLYDWYQQAYNTTISKSDFSRKKANQARNWLKYADDDTDTKYDILKQDSIMMLMRALPSYHKLTKSHTEMMERFFQYLKANIDEINALFEPT